MIATGKMRALAPRVRSLTHIMGDRFGLTGARRLQRPTTLPAQFKCRGILLEAFRADKRAGTVAFVAIRTQHRFGARAVGVIVQPYLRLRDIRRHFADDTRHVFVEYVRLDARVREAIDQQIGLDAMRCDKYSMHPRFQQRVASSAATSRSRTATSGAARDGSHGYGGVSSI